jgi:death-on-curing family protein
LSRSGDAEVKTLSVDMVLNIHDHLIREFSSTPDPIFPPGVRDDGLLASAVHRQEAGVRGYMKYDTPYSNAATLMFGICNNHPFHNGNKRTALVAGMMHLDANNLVLHAITKDDLYKLMLRIASHEMVRLRRSQKRKGVRPKSDDEVGEITKWLQEKSRKIRKGERNITYAELYRIIDQFGFKLGQKKHNKMEVLKQKKTLFGKIKFVCVYKVPCPGDSRIVTLNEIKSIREALELTESHGVDSESFYDTQMIIDVFVRQHRNVLRKLAKT